MADDRTRKQFIGDMLRSGRVPEKVELIVQDNTGQWDFSGAVLYYDDDYTASASVEYDGTSFNVSNYKLNVDETVGAGQDNYILTYDHSTGLIGLEVNTGAAGGIAIDDITDVTITSATTGDVLRYNGSAWVNYPDSNFAAASHTHVEADITDLGAYLENVVEDTTPQLGGDLDLNLFSITGQGSIASKGDLALAMTGTVSVTASTAAVTGVGTLFQTESRAGTAISIAGEVFTVASVTSNTALTLDSNHTAGAAGVTAYRDNPLVEIDNGNDELVLRVTDGGTSGSTLWVHSEQGNGTLYVDSVDAEQDTYFAVANDGANGGSYNYFEMKVCGLNSVQTYYAQSSILGFTPSVGPLYVGNSGSNQRWLKLELDTNKYVNVEDGAILRINDDSETYTLEISQGTTTSNYASSPGSHAFTGTSNYANIRLDNDTFADAWININNEQNTYAEYAISNALDSSFAEFGLSGSTYSSYQPGKAWIVASGDITLDPNVTTANAGEVSVRNGASFAIKNSGDAKYLTWSHNGAEVIAQGVGGGQILHRDLQGLTGDATTGSSTYNNTYSGIYWLCDDSAGASYVGMHNNYDDTGGGGPTTAYIEIAAQGPTYAFTTGFRSHLYATTEEDQEESFAIVGDTGAFLNFWDETGTPNTRIVEVYDGAHLRVMDSTGADYADHYHDGTSYYTNFATTSIWRIQGTLTSGMQLRDGITFQQWNQPNNKYFQWRFDTGNDTDVIMDIQSSGAEYKILGASAVGVYSGATFEIWDSTTTKTAAFSHDGAGNFDLAFTGLGNFSITGSRLNLITGDTGTDTAANSYTTLYQGNDSQFGYSTIAAQSGTGADYRYVEFGATGSYGFGAAHTDMTFLYYSTSSSTPATTDFVALNDYGDIYRLRDNTTYNSFDIISDSVNNETHLRIFDSTGNDSADIYHNGADLYTDFTTTGHWWITGLANSMDIRDGAKFIQWNAPNNKYFSWGFDSGDDSTIVLDIQSLGAELIFANQYTFSLKGGTGGPGPDFRLYNSAGTTYAGFQYDGTDLTLTMTTGDFIAGNYALDVNQTVGAGQDNYVLTYDNATGLISLEASVLSGGLDDLSDVTITSAATGDLLRYNGSAWVDYPDSNYASASHTHTVSDITDLTLPVTKYKTAIESVATSTTLQDDNHFTGWSLDSASWYKITAHLHTTQSDTAGDPKLNWTFTNAPQDQSYHYDSSNGGADYSTGGDTTLNRTVTTEVGTTMSGTFQTNATTGGTLKLRWAQVASAGTTSILPGSWVTIEKIS